jgi:hypothetical protein
MGVEVVAKRMRSLDHAVETLAVKVGNFSGLADEGR